MIDVLIAAVLIFAAIFSATVAVLPPVSLTYVVTACGILLTYRVAKTQAKLAERKLFLDLMQKRSEWWDRVKAALEGRAKERVDQIEEILSGNMPIDPKYLQTLWQLETEAGWWFGKEMVALMATMIAADARLNQTQMKARQGDKDAGFDVGKKAIALYAEQGKLQDYLVQYLYVGDIGKPKRSPVQFAKVQRRGPFGLLGPKVIRQDDLK